MRTICAWCDSKEKIDENWVDALPTTPEENKLVSSGICPWCKEKMVDELAEELKKEKA